MAKIRHAINLDQDVDELLRRRAGAMRLPPGVVAAALLSGLLQRPDALALLVAGDATPVPGGATPSTPQLSGAGGATPVPGDATPVPPPGTPVHGLFSSLTLPAPEKKKKNKTELPSEGTDEFVAGWKGYAKVGGRTGSKPKAVESWNALLAVGQWSPTEIRRRWATFAKLERPQFLPEVHRLLRPDCGKLTDESLHALEVRRRTENASSPGKAGEMDSESYEAQRARRVAASAPASGHQRPPGGPLMDDGPRPAGA